MDRTTDTTAETVVDTARPHEVDGYRVMPGWRVGVAVDEPTRSGLLIPAGTDRSNEAVLLRDVETGLRFWANPAEALRFIWPPTGEVVVAVRGSQVIVEQLPEDEPIEGRYL